MAITNVKIANMALTLVKQKPITSLTSTGAAATEIGVAYDIVVQEVLEDKETWEFLRARARLTRHADAPAYGGWLYMYKMPAQSLRIIETIDEDGDKINYPSSREVYVDGANTIDVLLCNQETCIVRYLVNRTTESDWPAWFVKLVYHRLAVVISGPLTNDDQRYNQLALWSKRAYDEAVQCNCLESTEVNDYHSDIDNGSDLIEIQRGHYGPS